MLLPRCRILLLGLTALSLSACASSVKTVSKWDHPTLGVVTTKHPEFLKTRKACGNKAYAKGITIHGQKVTDRLKAVDFWAKDTVKMNIGAGAHLYAQSSGGILKKTKTGSFYKPGYSDAFNALEKKTWSCVENKGFIRQKKS